MINIVKKKNKRYEKANLRSKKNIKVSEDRPRIVVIKSNRYISAQVIDINNKVLCQVSPVSKELKDKKLTKNIKSAEIIGAALGEKMKAIGIQKAVFDRNGYRFHGKVKALADACRKQGIIF